jgi:hypothetical protein
MARSCPLYREQQTAMAAKIAAKPPPPTKEKAATYADATADKSGARARPADQRMFVTQRDLEQFAGKMVKFCHDLVAKALSQPSEVHPDASPLATADLIPALARRLGRYYLRTDIPEQVLVKQATITSTEDYMDLLVSFNGNHERRPHPTPTAAASRN